MANIEFKHQINLMKKNIETTEKLAKLAGVREKIVHEENIKVYKEIIKNLKVVETYGGVNNLVRHATGAIKQADLFPVEPAKTNSTTKFQKQF